jgi:hypothetical protein
VEPGRNHPVAEYLEVRLGHPVFRTIPLSEWVGFAPTHAGKLGECDSPDAGEHLCEILHSRTGAVLNSVGRPGLEGSTHRLRSAR